MAPHDTHDHAGEPPHAHAGGPAPAHDHAHAHGEALSWWELWPMLAWGSYTVYLYATGRIFYLLQRFYGHLALGAGVVLLAAFAYGWLLRRRRLKADAAAEAAHPGAPPSAHPPGAPPAADGAACTCAACEGRSGAGRYLRSLAFIVPLVIGMSLPRHGPNALAAMQWGAGDLAMMAQLAARQETERAEMQRGYGWLTLMGVAQRLAGGQDEKVGAMGFVARKPGMPEDQFYLIRFTMACCAACAQPVAVPVRWPQAASLEKDQWVKVFGRLDSKDRVLVADDVEPIREPSDPYM